MNEMTLLRDLRSEDETTESEVLARVRTSLMSDVLADQETTAGNRAARKYPSASVRKFVFVGVAAAVVTGTIIVSSLLPGGATAEAAGVLERAALASIEGSDPIVAPGQFLEVRTEAVYPSFTSVPGSDDEDVWSWETAPVYLAPSVDVLYIPADRSQEWTLIRTYQAPIEFFGPGAREAAAFEWAELRTRSTETLVARDGEFYGGPRSYEDIQSLPRDGAELIDYIYSTYNGGSASPEEDAYSRIVEILRLGEIPSDLRAALYEALARIPGISITADQATLNGRTGIAIGREEPSRDWREEIIIDPETGWMIGERQITTSDYGQIPPGIVTKSTAVTIAVVDSIP